MVSGWERRARYHADMVVARPEAETQDVTALLAALGIAPVKLRLPPDWVLTNEKLLELCSLNDAVPFEVDETGALIVGLPSGQTSEWIGVEFVAALHGWRDVDAGDLVFGSGALFGLPDGSRRVPDAAWVSGERLQGIDIFDGDVWSVTPDFIVEVRSLTDDIEDLQQKMELWLRNGVRLGWLVDPFDERIWVYRPGEEAAVLGRPLELSDEAVLPGLVMDLSRIWR